MDLSPGKLALLNLAQCCAVSKRRLFGTTAKIQSRSLELNAREGPPNCSSFMLPLYRFVYLIWKEEQGYRQLIEPILSLFWEPLSVFPLKSYSLGSGLAQGSLVAQKFQSPVRPPVPSAFSFRLGSSRNNLGKKLGKQRDSLGMQRPINPIGPRACLWGHWKGRRRPPLNLHTPPFPVSGTYPVD